MDEILTNINHVITEADKTFIKIPKAVSQRLLLADGIQFEINPDSITKYKKINGAISDWYVYVKIPSGELKLKHPYLKALGENVFKYWYSDIKHAAGFNTNKERPTKVKKSEKKERIKKSVESKKAQAPKNKPKAKKIKKPKSAKLFQPRSILRKNSLH